MKEFKLDFYDRTSLKSYNLDESMRYQLAMLGSLDVFTRKHSENVASITCRMCEYLHMKDYFTVYCTICAYLHDIGKQFIPPSILQKNGPLTDEEFEIMKTHTTLGYELCIKDKFLRPYYAGPYYHHESLDGTGYPQGLTKKDIPYESQIIRVADEFDALVSKRQYKSHIGIRDALKIIIDHTKPSPNAPKGTGYTNAGKINPLIVKKLIKVIIEDTELEIVACIEYIDYLVQETKRYKKIEKIINKINTSKKQVDIDYYKEYIKYFLRRNESIDNFDQAFVELNQTLEQKRADLKELYKEVKLIKKIRV